MTPDSEPTAVEGLTALQRLDALIDHLPDCEARGGCPAHEQVAVIREALAARDREAAAVPDGLREALDALLVAARDAKDLLSSAYVEAAPEEPDRTIDALDAALTPFAEGIATPDPRPVAPLDERAVHLLLCERLVLHEPGAVAGYLWPCTKFIAEYARLTPGASE